jgi:hypothetical protein
MDTIASARTRSEEAAEREIERFIERRSRNGETTEDDVDVGYLESCRRFHERSEAAMRERWVEYHRHLQVLHQNLADEHEAEAEKLEGPSEPESAA